jgi:hypothetical protein
MSRTWKYLLWMATGLGLAGCGGAEAPKPEVSAAAEAAKKAALDKPEVAVFQFLEAVRTGNDSQAAFMLTPMARKKTSEMNLAVSPPGSKTANFKVGQVEYVTEDGAHVASTWSDVDESGERQSDEIIWMLRHETEGWRIAGMATKLFEDSPPLYLNFEDPEDMVRKQQLAAEEIARRMKAEVPSVTNSADAKGQPASPDSATKRR